MVGASRGRQIVQSVVVVGLLAACLAPVAWAGQPVVLGRACVRDVRGLIEKAGAVVEQFAPGQGAMVTAGAAMFLQGDEWKGVDWGKPVGAAILSGKAYGKTEPVVIVIFPLADPDAFKQARQQAAQPNEKLQIRGNFGLLTDTDGAFDAITDQRLQIYTVFPQEEGAADVYFTLYVQRAIQEYQADIDAAIAVAQEQAAGMGAVGPFAALAQLQKAAGPLAKLAGQQLHRVSALAQLNTDSLDLTGRLYAVDDSHLATFLSGQPAETTDLVKHLPGDAVMGMAAKVDIAKLRPLVQVALDTLAAPLELTPEGKAKVLDLFFASTATGEFAAAYAGGPATPGLQQVQVARIADPAKFRAATKQSVEWMMNSIFGTLMQGMGIEMTVKHEAGVREHQGVSVDRITLTVNPGGDQPNPMAPPPQYTELAAVDTLGLATSGTDASGALLNALIDRVKGGGAGQPTLLDSAAYKATRAAAPQDANMVMFLSFNSFVAKFIEEIAKQQPMIAMMAGGIAKADPTEAPITSYGKFTQGHVDFRTHIPYQPLVAFAARLRAVIQQMQGGGARPPRPGPAPGPDDDF